MGPDFRTESSTLQSSARYRQAKAEMLAAIAEAATRLRGIQPPKGGAEGREQYLKQIQDFNRDRGRDIFYPLILSGLGSGPFVELLDGSVKYDMITGIGINFFGHSHPELIAEMIDALPADILQGNLEPGHEAQALLRALLSRVGAGSRLTKGWLTTCGTMANEIALKIIRQKRAPATKILAFRDCFSGRSTAMQEITDNPKYREGQPVYGEVEYLPFYDPKLGLEDSIGNSLQFLHEHLHRYPGKFSALMIELVQGEGGFLHAPREWYVRLFDEVKKAGLAIWIDEVQTFGRTGELFAYQKFGLHDYVDVVTVAKTLQAGVVLFTDEYNPKAGLVAGTFSGGTGALRAARRILEILSEPSMTGPDGKIEKLSARFASNLKKLSEGSCRGFLSDIRNVGGMIAFQPFTGTLDEVKAVLMKLFDQGVIAFYCGHGPILVRLLPPLAVMSEVDVDAVCKEIETALIHIQQGKESKK